MVKRWWPVAGASLLIAIVVVAVVFHFRKSNESEHLAPALTGSELDYSKMVMLDAKELAAGGIREAYESLLPKLRQYLVQPRKIEEVVDNNRYAVRYGEKEFVISGPELDDREHQSWGRATYAFFTIVNDQLAGSEYRFYAINGANDLGGLFLTPSQAEAARKKLPRKDDWPYLPTNEHPSYGQYH